MGIAEFIIFHQMMEENQRQEEQERKKREEKRKRKQEEEKRREEEYQKMIKHRKFDPVIYNDEEWQQERCLLALSMEPCIEKFIIEIEEAYEKRIKHNESIYYKSLINVGYRYEVARRELIDIIANLKKLNVVVSGQQYKLTRVNHINANAMTTPERISDQFGNTFTINNGEPIELNSWNYTNISYFSIKYEETKPIEVKKEYDEIKTKLEKYQKYGKHLKFILDTNKYKELEKEFKDISEKYEYCELRKRKEQSFNSLTNTQTETIKLYLQCLEKLKEISKDLDELFKGKEQLRNGYIKSAYDSAIKDVIANAKNSILVHEAYEYINKILTNDKETMKKIYELVKGIYPIKVKNQFIYELIISNRGNMIDSLLDNNSKEDVKILKRSQ